MLRHGIRDLFLLAIIFSVVILCNDTRAEDWVVYARYGDDTFCYDRANINNPYEDLKDVIGVWQKITYDVRSANRIASHLGIKYADLAESISMVEIDCARKYAQTKAITYYDAKGRVIETKQIIKDDWKKITSESPPLAKLHRVVCLRNDVNK